MTPTQNADPLAGLRAYHLPDPVSWWPPAPGWWLLASLALVIAAAAALSLLRRYRQGASARVARTELETLAADYTRDHDAAALARGLSRLLRRFALASFPHHRVAGLTGDDWLAFLDEQGGHGRFRAGSGRFLLEAPYRPVSDLPADELVALVGEWIERNGGARV